MSADGYRAPLSRCWRRIVSSNFATSSRLNNRRILSDVCQSFPKRLVNTAEIEFRAPTSSVWIGQYRLWDRKLFQRYSSSAFTGSLRAVRRYRLNLTVVMVVCIARTVAGSGEKSACTWNMAALSSACEPWETITAVASRTSPRDPEGCCGRERVLGRQGGFLAGLLICNSLSDPRHPVQL